MTKIDVLDHGFVRLVSYMQAAEMRFDRDAGASTHGWSGDLEIVRNARVSYNADWRPGDPASLEPDHGRDEKLVHYLHRHRHTTPFEAMAFTFEVQAPIFVFRQWHRHRTWTYNEVSARYTELPELYYVPDITQLREQSQKNKQGRGAELPEASTARFSMESHFKEGFRRYHELLDMGMARELARLVLPLSTYSRMFASVDLHNLFHFLELRLDEHAQYEIRVYAEALLKLIEPIVPVAVAAFREEPNP